ncbi:flagellin [Enterovirga rhinocerotis]|uniref:Flagellin n=1 Tax=Enterovirga rhinocerotis TaxID=1339210 RepID=A0A4V3DYL5_9HYPH|nr:flagellin [Enterovirga rhinocerotis]TDR93149.1 flagellin-like hook-associated protein FlgL [Enterovirga rhinocerotis]
MSNIVLSNGVRQNLLSLQDTTRLAEKTQLRLATGKKVNTALDDPVNYFTSATLSNRANLLSGLLDGISNGIQTIQAASSGIDAITKLVQSAQATIRQALNEAAQNRPSRIGATSLGSEGVSINQTPQDVALNKKLEGALAPATTTSSGALGIAANSYVTVQAGNTTYQFQTNANMTVRDLVSEINKSGIATASVDSTGKFSVTGTGSNALSFRVESAIGTNDGTDNLGFAAADVTALGTGVSATANSAIRTGLIDQFNNLRTQMGKLAQDTGYNGTNLLGGNMLKIVFNEKTGAARNTIDIQGFTITADSLGIQSAANATVVGSTNFQNDIDLANADEALTTALNTLRSMASTLGSNLAVVQSRQDFTKSMMTTLKSGADNLVLADSNEEGANLLALQTRQQLSQTALSLAAQADQSVLKLFG